MPVKDDVKIDVKIDASWKRALSEEFSQEYFRDLVDFIKEDKGKHKIYPQGSLYFNGFDSCLPDKVKVVILGQDPYHGVGQAHGLCFSVNEGISFPPSLRNIFLELKNDIGIEIPKSGNLQRWAEQGVFLLNSTLTVRAGQAGSHQGKGWERFTDATIKYLSDSKQNLVFILWGAYAQQKGSVIDISKHLILQSPHPSPFSADRGFFGCKHFSKCNEYLAKHNIPPIAW